MNVMLIATRKRMSPQILRGVLNFRQFLMLVERRVLVGEIVESPEDHEDEHEIVVAEACEVDLPPEGPAEVGPEELGEEQEEDAFIDTVDDGEVEVVCYVLLDGGHVGECHDDSDGHGLLEVGNVEELADADGTDEPVHGIATVVEQHAQGTALLGSPGLLAVHVVQDLLRWRLLCRCTGPGR